MSDGHGSEVSSSTYRVASDESVSEGVVRVVSALTGVPPVPGWGAAATAEALDPLHTVVDPGALDALFPTGDGADDGTRVRVTFAYHGYEVTVREGGLISAERTVRLGDEVTADR